MTLTVFIVVLAAAVTHALWNAWLKTSGDRLVSLAMLAIGWAIVGLASIPMLGVPGGRAWIFLGASILVHTLYALALIGSYRAGDLTSAYPIARGLGPLVVAVASTVFLDDPLSTAGAFGIALIVSGIVGLSFPWTGLGRSSVAYSLATGALIGTYTLLDGIGGRTGASAHVYAAWLFLLTAVPVALIALAVHRGSTFLALARPLWRKGIAAGVLSAAAYWAVIWAMSQSHMGLVAALRESSVVVAAVLGARYLRERVRWAAIGLVFAGIVLVKAAEP